MSERIRHYSTWAMIAALVLLACAAATHSVPAGLIGLAILLAGGTAFVLSTWYEQYWLDWRETRTAKWARRVLAATGFAAAFYAGIVVAVAVTPAG